MKLLTEQSISRKLKPLNQIAIIVFGFLFLFLLQSSKVFSQVNYNDPKGYFSVKFQESPDYTNENDDSFILHQHVYYGEEYTQIVSITSLTDGFSDDQKADIINAYISEFYYAIGAKFNKIKTVSELSNKTGNEYSGEMEGDIVLSWVFAEKGNLYHAVMIYNKNDYSKFKEDINSFFKSFKILK